MTAAVETGASRGLMPMVVASGGGLGRCVFAGFAGRPGAEPAPAGRFAGGLVFFVDFRAVLVRFFAVAFATFFVAALLLRVAGLMTPSPSCLRLCWRAPRVWARF